MNVAKTQKCVIKKRERYFLKKFLFNRLTNIVTQIAYPKAVLVPLTKKKKNYLPLTIQFPVNVQRLILRKIKTIEKLFTIRYRKLNNKSDK